MGEVPSNPTKVVFELEQDEDGYPPVGSESVWASHIGDSTYVLEDIPFFARGVSLGDTVTAITTNGERLFQSVVQRSGHSTIRVVVFDESNVQGLRDRLRALGCDSELSHIAKLFSVDVPPHVPYQDVQTILDEGERQGRWEYEESCIVHNE